MNTCFLLLGSNQGDRINWLRQGAGLIADLCGSIVGSSGIYETAAWGLEEQPDFLNQVIKIYTALSPEELLEHIQQIEIKLERQRIVKWGQRTLDIDILFYNDLILNHPNLTIPHPYLAVRRFTLAPLAELAPEWEHPVLHLSVSRLLLDCPDPLPTRRISD